MSEPVKNAEIEDVLASIRRLVSGDQRAVQPPRADAARKPAADRLVLTPSLRVTSTPDTPPAATEGDATAATLDLSQDERVHADHGDDPEPRDAAPQDHPTDTDSTGDEDRSEAGQDRQDEGAEQQAEPPWGDPEARLFDARADTVSDPDQDTPAQDWEDWNSDAADKDAAGARAFPDDDLGARIAALEDVVARSDDHWEPDTAGSGDYAGTEVETLEWEELHDGDATGDEDTASREAAGAPDDESDKSERRQSTADQGPDGDLFSDGPVLDEAALRDLIADIVREELQGALGERITRNVRKLVRREIQRALTMQDLE